MHELSLALEVIDLANREAGNHGVSKIREIEIEVGDLSGVEADAFLSALELIVQGTILENSALKIVRTPGQGYCRDCNSDFDMHAPLDGCPTCKSYPSRVWGGREFRVLSLLAD